MPRFKCDCGRSIAYEPSQAGKKIRCPDCKKSHLVPDDDDDEEEIEDEEEDEEEEAPVRKRGKGKDKPTGFMYLLGSIIFSGPGAMMILFLVCLGVGLTLYGYFEHKASAGASQEPGRVNYDQVIANGIPPNAHVTFSDFVMGTNYVFVAKIPKSEKEKPGGINVASFPWQAVYVPLVPLTEEQRKRNFGILTTDPAPPMSKVRVILRSNKVKNFSELMKEFPQNTAQGMLAPAPSRLDAQADAELRKHYPGLDLKQVYILDMGRKPRTAVFTVSLLVSGSFVLFLAAILGALGFMYRPS